jgi:hypothetical protein
MSSPAVPTAAPPAARSASEQLRVAFVGGSVWLDGCSPPLATRALVPQRVAVDRAEDRDRAADALRDFGPDVTVVLDPLSLPGERLEDLPGTTLGVLVGGLPDDPGPAPGARAAGDGLRGLDRLISFRPALTGAQVGGAELWRAIPPPVSDALFADVRPLRGKPRAIAVGRSSAHREWMLLPAKHHHDLLHVIHGVSGAPLVELLAESDVGVYVALEPGGGFGQQVGMHLAAGHLLLAETLTPAHGLERNIDYLHVDSPDGLAWVLERLERFPEMHQRIRARGRMKAEQYRASRVFARLAGDLLADVAAFG